MNRWLNCISILLFGSVLAQPNNEEVTIIFKGNRQIESVYRIAEQPKILDTVIPFPEVNYPLLSLRYPVSIKTDTIEAVKLRLQERMTKLYPGYIRGGVSTVFMPVLDVYYTSTRSRKYHYGGRFQHLSSTAGMRGQAPAQFARNAVDGFGAIHENTYSATGNVHFNTRGLHWYGFPNEAADRDSIFNRFTNVGTNLTFAHHPKDSLTLNIKGGVSYDYLQDRRPKATTVENWFGREHSVGLFGEAWMKKKKDVYSVRVSGDYVNYAYGNVGDTLTNAQDTGFVQHNFIVRLQPKITTYAFNNRLKTNVGMDVSMAHLGKTQLFVYPMIEAKYALLDDLFIPYLMVDGGLEQQSFHRLSRSNEFMLSNVGLRNENRVLSGKLGIKGTLSKNIGFNVSARFSHIRDKAFFVNDTLFTAGNRFGVVYDTLNLTSFEGSLYYQRSEQIKIDLIGRFHSYQLRNELFAWNLPQVEFIARGKYALDKQWMFTLDLTLEGGRWSKRYAAGEGIYEENLQFAQRLGFLADVNLQAEYRYTERLSGFVQLNNLGAQRYQRWYAYPVQGFQFLLGASFRF